MNAAMLEKGKNLWRETTTRVLATAPTIRRVAADRRTIRTVATLACLLLLAMLARKMMRWRSGTASATAGETWKSGFAILSVPSLTPFTAETFAASMKPLGSITTIDPRFEVAGENGETLILPSAFEARNRSPDEMNLELDLMELRVTTLEQQIAERQTGRLH